MSHMSEIDVDIRNGASKSEAIAAAAAKAKAKRAAAAKTKRAAAAKAEAATLTVDRLTRGIKKPTGEQLLKWAAIGKRIEKNGIPIPQGKVIVDEKKLRALIAEAKKEKPIKHSWFSRGKLIEKQVAGALSIWYAWVQLTACVFFPLVGILLGISLIINAYQLF